MAQGSLSGWTEGILLTIAFIAVLGIIVTNMNGLYNRNEQIGLGVNTTPDDFINYQQNADAKIKGSEANFDSLNGITLRSSWELTQNAYSVITKFITGGFIQELFYRMGTGEAGNTYAKYLQIIWFLGLIFAILYILFKVII